MPPANNIKTKVANKNPDKSHNIASQHANRHHEKSVQDSNWMTTDVASEAYSPSVRYSMSTTISFDTHQEHVTSGNKKYIFKNSEVGSFQQQHNQNDLKKSVNQKATCHEHYVISSQKSLDMDHFSQQYLDHTPFNLLNVDDNTLYSTTIIKINPNDLNRRLTSLKRGADSITKEEILRVLHLNQQQASSRLGCSVSTLKRRFYVLREELGLSKWPNNYFESCEKRPELFKQIYPLSLRFIMNSE